MKCIYHYDLLSWYNSLLTLVHCLPNHDLDCLKARHRYIFGENTHGTEEARA